MATPDAPQPGIPADAGPKDHEYRTPPGHRVLHLVIEQPTFELLHIQAIKSGMRFAAYTQRSLKTASPFDGSW
jgi:hypothetical protein